ncbi:Long-chain-fatty-acid--CoA ligase 5, partial [Nowakowskiella sp. JEL0078]
LPLAHTLERAASHFLAYTGCKIGFYRGDTAKLFDDLSTLSPTIFVTVPRIMYRLRDRILQNVSSSSSFKKAIFNLSFNSKLKLLREGRVTRNTIWDTLVFNNIASKAGGKIRFILTGSAPATPEVIDFLRVVLGCQVIEGYGQTENFAGATATIIGDYQSPYGSHVGVPFPCNEIKLVDVEEMGFLATNLPNPRGELCIRGYNVMKGYWNDPVNTA